MLALCIFTLVNIQVGIVRSVKLKKLEVCHGQNGKIQSNLGNLSRIRRR